MNLLDTFAGRYIEDGDCLRWTGACCNGHPSFRATNGKTALVRRALWEEQHGAIPHGKILRCTCETPKCINLCHCVLTTHKRLAKQNGERGLMSGPVRSAKIAATHRARHPKTKLTQDEARAIRDSAETISVLGERYGVAASTAARIKRGEVRREYGGNPFAGLGA